MPKPERGARGVATRTSPEHVLQMTKAAVAIETEAELRARERANLIAALERSGGKVYGSGGAAELLRVPSTTLTSRLPDFDIRRSRRGPERGCAADRRPQERGSGALARTLERARQTV